jgi:4-amino-4-deoxy-L-arabinose transferase-like glycosyltransferase
MGIGFAQASCETRPVPESIIMPVNYPPDALSSSRLSRWVIEHRTGVLLLLGALLYVAFIGLRDLWYPDELDIGEVARAMYLSGDWISPRRMGVIWVDYPPMIYWLGTLFSHLLGEMSAFSLRLPNALAAICTGVITCVAASRWFDARTGFWAGLCLLTLQYFLYQGNSYRPDILFTLFITAGMLVYAQGAGDKPRWWLRVAGFALLGLAMLSKGPLGLLLPGLVLTLWHGSRREWLRVLELGPLALISLAVYLPWFAATADAMGWSNIAYELYAQNLERFQDGSIRGHQHLSYFYYFKSMWLDMHPWSWLLPPALWWLLRSGRWRDPRIQLFLWWFGAFFVFLSIAETKRQLYLLPAYPSVALLLGPWLANVGQAGAERLLDAPGSRPLRIYSLILAIVFLALAIALFVLQARYSSIVAGLDLNEQKMEVARLARLPLAVTGIVLLVSGLLIAQAWKRGKVRGALRRISAAHVALYVVLLSLVLPAMEPNKSYAAQSAWIRAQIGDETHFGMVYPAGSIASSTGRAHPSGVARRGGFAYHTDAMVDLLYSREEVENFFREHPRSVVLIHEGSVDPIFAGQEEAWNARVIGWLRTGVHLYAVVRGPAQQGPDSREGTVEGYRRPSAH